METRLKKSLQNCGICLQKVLNCGQLDSCHHLFCLTCIKNWSEIENTCPLCKKRFTKLSPKLLRKRYDHSRQKQKQNISIAQKNQGPNQQMFTFSLEDLTNQLFNIMEFEPDLWNAFLQLGFANYNHSILDQ